MKPVRKATLSQLCEQLAAHPWQEAKLAELVDPEFGIITGFQDPLDDLEKLRRVDLDTLPPAQSVRVADRER